jgi:phenylalanyl-tRNA synthetase beta chain
MNGQAQAISVANPLSVEQSVMRTTLLPSLVGNIIHSRRHQAEGVRVYEIARSYRSSQDGGREGRPVADEQLEVAGALWGLRDRRANWCAKDGVADFFDAKAAVEAILRALHVEDAAFERIESDQFHPRASARVKVGGVTVGTMGELHPRAAKALDAPGGVFLFQLSLESLLSCARLVPQAQPIGRYPAVLRDLAVVVNHELPAEEIRNVVMEIGAPLVGDARVFDVYTGPQLGLGRKNVALALRYQSSERTLTDAEVNEAHGRIVAEVSKRFGASLRS